MDRRQEQDRIRAIECYWKGESISSIAQSLGYSRPWTYKWIKRNRDEERWAEERSRRPRGNSRQVSNETVEAVKLVLSEPTVLANGKRIPGLKLVHPRQLALMQALVRFSHIAAGAMFPTAEVHADTAKPWVGASPTTSSARCVTTCPNFEPKSGSRKCRTLVAID